MAIVMMAELADMNAINALLAVMKWKQHLGF
jgi:hypothetical protein